MRAVHILNIFFLFSFVAGLGARVAFAEGANPIGTCTDIISLDGKISILPNQPVDSLDRAPLYESNALFGVAEFVGPHLIGRKVQVQVVTANKQKGYIRGHITGSEDNWQTYRFQEEATGTVVSLWAEHPDLSVRRIEFLDAGFPPLSAADMLSLEEATRKFDAETEDLDVIAERVKIRAKIKWYRTKNGRNLRTTFYDRFHKLAQMEYLIGLGRLNEALEAMRTDVDNSKLPAIAIHSAVAYRDRLQKAIDAAPTTVEARPMIRMLSEVEDRLKQQGKILGAHYPDYRAYVDRLKMIRENRDGRYEAHMVSGAAALEKMITVINASSALTPALLNGVTEPNLEYVQKAYFAQNYSLTETMRKELWAERMTFLWLMLNKITGQEIFRVWGEKLIEKLPSVLRSPFNVFLKSKRDIDARRFDFPQIARVLALNGTIEGKLEEIRKVFYGERESKLLKNFGRIKDAEEQQLWSALFKVAEEKDPEFHTLMKEHERIGEEWGPLSKHYHQNGLNMTAAVITMGGVGSGWAFYQWGPQDNWLWQAIDMLASFVNPFG